MITKEKKQQEILAAKEKKAKEKAAKSNKTTNQVLDISSEASNYFLFLDINLLPCSIGLLICIIFFPYNSYKNA